MHPPEASIVAVPVHKISVLAVFKNLAAFPENQDTISVLDRRQSMPARIRG
jgi:hypothetical protein